MTSLQYRLDIHGVCLRCRVVSGWRVYCRPRKVDVRLPGIENSRLPWREAGPPNHHDDNVDSDQ